MTLGSTTTRSRLRDVTESEFTRVVSDIGWPKPEVVSSGNLRRTVYEVEGRVVAQKTQVLRSGKVVQERYAVSDDQPFEEAVRAALRDPFDLDLPDPSSEELELEQGRFRHAVSEGLRRIYQDVRSGRRALFFVGGRRWPDGEDTTGKVNVVEARVLDPRQVVVTDREAPFKVWFETRYVVDEDGFSSRVYPSVGYTTFGRRVENLLTNEVDSWRKVSSVLLKWIGPQMDHWSGVLSRRGGSEMHSSFDDVVASVVTSGGRAREAALSDQLSDVMKHVLPHMYVLYRMGKGQYGISIGDPKKSSSKAVRGPIDEEELRWWVRDTVGHRLSPDHVIDLTGMRLVPDRWSEFYLTTMRPVRGTGQTGLSFDDVIASVVSVGANEGPFTGSRRSASNDWLNDRWDKIISGDKARIRWNRDVYVVEELPSKPLKRRLRRAWFLLGRALPDPYSMPDHFLMVNLLRDAKPSSSMTYEQAVGAMKKALEKAVKDARDLLADWQIQGVNRLPEEESVYYLEVEPSDYDPLSVQGKDFVLDSSWTSFKVVSPSGYDEQESMANFYKEKSAGAARKLYKILKSDPEALKSVAWKDLTKWFDSNRIGYDYVPSVWR